MKIIETVSEVQLLVRQNLTSEEFEAERLRVQNTMMELVERP